jgi:hypothetical protein
MSNLIATSTYAIICAGGGSSAAATTTVAVTPLPPPNPLIPLASYGMNEGLGTTSGDSLGITTGTLTNGPIWTTGQYGQGISFDGINDFIDLGTTVLLKPSLPITMSAWIKTNAIGSTQGIMTNDKTGHANHSGAWMDLNSNGKITVHYGSNTGCDSYSRRTKVGTTTLSPNTWYHIAAVIQGATNMQIYVNGVNDNGSYSGTGGSLAYATGGRSVIGKVGNCPSGDYIFNGVIDDVRFYDKALTQTEVAGDMGTGI